MIRHVCYAPELETFDDTRNKLISRNVEVLNRLPTTRQSTFDLPVVDSQPSQKTVFASNEQSVINEALSSSNDVTPSTSYTDVLNERVKDEQTTDVRLVKKSFHSQSTSFDQPRKRIVYHQTAKKVAVVKKPRIDELPNNQ